MGASRSTCHLFPFLVLLSTCFSFSSASRLLREEGGCVDSIDDKCPLSATGHAGNNIGVVGVGTNNAPGSVCFACANNNVGGIVVALPGISMPGLAIGLPTISIGGAGIQIGGYGYGGMIGYIPGYGYGYSLCCIPVGYGYGYGAQTLNTAPQQDSAQTGSKPSAHMDSHQIHESVSDNKMQRQESQGHTVNHDKQVVEPKMEMRKQGMMGVNYNKHIVKPKMETMETQMHGSKDIHEGDKHVVKADIGKQSGGNNHKNMNTMSPMSH